MKRILPTILLSVLTLLCAKGETTDPFFAVVCPEVPLPADTTGLMLTDVVEEVALPDSVIDEQQLDLITTDIEHAGMLDIPDVKSIYCHPYSMTLNSPDWKRMWTNTAVLAGAYVGTLLVLECLPADATAWNRAEIRDVPLFKRWRNHVLRQGPEWDHDNPIFNYVLHPYAGAAYFMSARSCGFNFWRSLLYSACVSTIGWEFGIEAFMERPSIQDIFITPLVGSAIGECFYRAKRHIVEDDYHLLGSKVLGNIAVFFLDPVNEAIDLFRGRNTHCAGTMVTSSLSPVITDSYKGFSLQVTF